MFNCFLFLSVSVQVSDAYVNVLSTVVFFSLNFNFFDMFLFLKIFLYHKICFVSIFYSFLQVYLVIVMSKLCSTKNILKIIELHMKEKIRHFELLPLYCTSLMGTKPSQIMLGAPKV